MLNDFVAKNVIHHGLDLGADFVELFIEENNVESISFLSSKVKDLKSGTDFGIGIRLFFHHQSLYGYTNSPVQEDLIDIINMLVANYKAEQNSAVLRHQNIKKTRPQTFQRLNYKAHQPPPQWGLNQQFSLEKKIHYLSQIDQSCRKQSLISQVDLSTIQRWQKIEIFNSEGLHAQDERHYTRLYATAIAQDGTQKATAFTGPGGLGGFEILLNQETNHPLQVAEMISRRALTSLKADPCPAGKMPVLIDNGFGGVIFHEACGHLLETTSVEKKASVFHDKMGQMIAHPAVNAVDDGTMSSEWGSINIDDEGMPTEKTQLIKEGKLVNFLVDRMGHLKTGYKRSGSGRRQSYHFAAASRMRNTFIEPGPYSLDEILSTIDYGLLAKTMGGGSVLPGTGEFNFAVEEAYLIEKGKITRPVKGATLIGTGPEVLQKISMVANNFQVAPGMCGSVSGSVPVTVGQAALKVDEILVGGKN